MERIGFHYSACVFLIFMAVLYVGCTAIGHVIGDAIDEHNVRSEAVILSADSCGCEKGDRVKLILVSGDSLTGQVKEIKSGEYLRVMTRFPEPVTYDSGRVEQIPWADIQSIEVIKKPIGWRVALTTVGVLIDVTIYLGMRALSSLSGAFESMGA